MWLLWQAVSEAVFGRAAGPGYPKQFLDILNTGKSLIQWTFERYAAFIPCGKYFRGHF
jgi:hypothetical protein